jgi:hypothetical protein
MRQVSLVAASVGLVLFLGGCSGEGGDAVSQETPAASSGRSPQTGSPSASPGNTGQPQTFAQPARAQNRQNRPRGIMPSDLISSTNPDQRLRSIESARPDPFARLSTNPAVTITRAPILVAPKPPVVTHALLPQAIPVLPDIPRLPRPLPNAAEPQPELARAVSVSGVVQIGGTVYAIVDAPDEPSSRYVQVGQRLSNGEILVRRIDFDGSDSSVILEQSGMQVVRRVGDAPIVPIPPAAPSTPTRPAAAA